jgi:hypothetical protein
VNLRTLRNLKHCRRVVILALLALVTNQIAFATHACVGMMGSDHPFVAAGIDHGGMSGHAGHRQPNADPQVLSPGCAVHCSHAADGNQQGKIPTLPFAAGTADFVALHASTPASIPATFWIDGAARPIDRRVVVFLSLLI